MTDHKFYKPQTVGRAQRILEDAAIHLNNSAMPEDTRAFVVQRLREIAKSETETRRFAGMGRGRPKGVIYAPTGTPTSDLRAIEEEGHYINGKLVATGDLRQPLNLARIVLAINSEGYPLKDNEKGEGAFSRAAEICNVSSQTVRNAWEQCKALLRRTQ